MPAFKKSGRMTGSLAKKCAIESKSSWCTSAGTQLVHCATDNWLRGCKSVACLSALLPSIAGRSDSCRHWTRTLANINAKLAPPGAWTRRLPRSTVSGNTCTVLWTVQVQTAKTAKAAKPAKPAKPAAIYTCGETQ